MAVCYRHPNRETGVSCSSCGRPICPDCMTPTPVGMRCPECARDRTKVKTIRTAPSAPVVTQALIVINVLVFLAETATGAPLQGGGGNSSVYIHGATVEDSLAAARERAQAGGLAFVHPFDDPDVIAGQGTVGMEILRQHQGPIHAVFVAIGGGGLISGVGAYIKAVRPEIKVIGVQMADSDAMIRWEYDRVRLLHHLT